MRCSVPDARPALARRSRAASVCARAALSDLGLNPRVASLKESKTKALTDLARAMKEEGKPVRARVGRSACCALRRSPPSAPGYWSGCWGAGLSRGGVCGAA